MHLFDRATIDEAVWTELEELLVAADVGVNTAGKLIEKVKRTGFLLIQKADPSPVSALRLRLRQ